MRNYLFTIPLLLVAQLVFAQSDCSKQGDELEARIDARVVAEAATPEQIQEAKRMKQMLKTQLPAFCMMDVSILAGIIDQQLDDLFPPRTEEERTVDRAMGGLSKEDLTNEYLRGQWCNTPGENTERETVTYEFAADGSYKSGFPNVFYPEKFKAEYGVEVPDRSFTHGSKNEFLKSFDRLRSLEASHFSVLGPFKRNFLFDKGPCPYY